MLSCVLNIIAKPLEHSLRWLQRSEPTRQDVEPLSKVLKPHISFPRTGSSDHTELESWTNTHPGGIAASIRHTIQSLVQWSLAAGANVMPASYTHRQILAGVRLQGAKRLLNSILEEVKFQSAAGSGSVAIDIAAAIVCAPDTDSFSSTPDSAQLMNMLGDTSSTSSSLQRRLTLRDALRTEAENASKIHKDDILQAETIVRLYRRVEAMMAPPITQATMLDHGLGDLTVGAGALDVGVGVGIGNGIGNGILDGTQHLNDAMVAAADKDMMDALAGNGMMNIGDDDLLENMQMDF
jgi:mediator of RNA polymerase II transcription subunit 5